ncbi:cytochrome P450 [Streptomyces sp. NPDC012888]|uniref:cytochrome P450 family protein n=1 Tax=Streptomyces sp. NPDC012888 TaxID=3364855 RepID=UPI00369EADB9
MPTIDFRPDADGADAFNADPYPAYARAREAGPVHRFVNSDGTEGWLVVGHEAAREALNHPDLCKNSQLSTFYAPGSADEVVAVSTNMLEADPPDHTRLRRLVVREFTARRVEALRPRVQQITDGLLDAMAAEESRSADLIRALAFPLPMTVICELLGVPDLDRDRFRLWSNEIVAPSAPEAAAEAFKQMSDFLTELIADKAGRPGEDLLSALIRTRDEDGDRLTHDELIGMAYLLLIAGHETTVNLIANGVRALLAHPAQLAALRADPDGLLDGAVEEMLRYDGPVENATYRFARTEVELAGTVVPAGATVLVSLAGADHDPARFARPDSFDIHRAPQGHLAFGHGIHYCLGAPLARLEGRVAIRSLLERFPGLAADPAAGPPEWVPGSLIRGLRRLPVRW